MLDITWGPESHGAKLHIDDHLMCNTSLPMVIDVETDELDNFVGIGICGNPEHINYFSELTGEVRQVLESGLLIGHNIKSDAKWLRKWGAHLTEKNIAYDTSLASYVQDSTKSSHGLKTLTKDILGYEYPTYKEMVGKGKSKATLDKQPVELVANYCGMDALSTYGLLCYFKKVLSPEQDKYLREIELPTMWALLLMEERGVSVNVSHLKALDYRFNVELQRISEKIKLCAPSIININSDKQVGDFLVSRGITLPKTPTGRPSVSVKALESFEGIPFIKALGRYSELEKLTSTYTQSLIERNTGSGDCYRLRGNFNQAVTNTGRLSSSNPNLQNIPARTGTGNLIREVFEARAHSTLIDADYSQIEPRLFAHFSQDPALLKIFNEGHDLYDYVTGAVGLCVCKQHRQLAKVLWLALSYNAGAFRISQTARISYNQAIKFVDKMKQVFNTAFKWKESVIREADSNKYITTLLGRQITVPDCGMGPNYKVQGSAAEVMKKALIVTSEFNPILTVHDELLFDVPDDHVYDFRNQIKYLMESVIKLSVPLIVEVGVGRTWREAKEAA